MFVLFLVNGVRSYYTPLSQDAHPLRSLRQYPRKIILVNCERTKVNGPHSGACADIENSADIFQRREG